MTNFLPLPCPKCGGYVRTYTSQENNGAWYYQCLDCEWGESDYTADHDTEEAAYLAACEIINRARMIPIEETLPHPGPHVAIGLGWDRAGWLIFDGLYWLYPMASKRHVRRGENKCVSHIIGWWLRLDEGADLRESGVRK